jgi:hypothetical protein
MLDIVGFSGVKKIFLNYLIYCTFAACKKIKFYGRNRTN